MKEGFSIIPVRGITEIKPGDELAAVIAEAARSSGLALRDGDVVVVAAKIVSKAEDRFVNLSDVEPTPFAYGAAKTLDKDPRVMEIILKETLRIVKMEKGKLIVENMHGVICANAGVDLSNVAGGDVALLLPEDPDASARNLHEGLSDKLGVDVAVIVTDTVGRPWRDGLVQVAIGCYGIDPVRDYRGSRDSMGMSLEATIIAQADELASAAGLMFGKTEGIPVVLIRGYEYEKSTDSAKKLLRKPEDDLFR